MPNKIIVRNHFPAVERAGWEAVQEAREVWKDVGQETAQAKVDQQASTRGYNLSIGIGKESLGFQSARIFAAAHSERWGDDPWWVRFFEYGTVAIPAMPFMRPGATKANKAFSVALGETYTRKVRRARA